MNTTDYKARMAAAMPEKELQKLVEGLGIVLGWINFHDRDSRKNNAGFPDLVMAHDDHGVLFAELKSQKGRFRPEQEVWLGRLRKDDQRVYVWRPSDWFDGSIRAVLEGRA